VDDLAHRYSVVSGHPLAHWDFQMALGYFKLAIIVAGIEFRARMAAGGGQTDDSEQPLGEAVAVLISGGLAALS
jgi:aminoglycoside phosphotransferase (APT) family kinase protein